MTTERKRKLRGRGLSNCQKCECLTELEKLKKELQITREYIHDNNLEWDLLSYLTRKEATS